MKTLKQPVKELSVDQKIKRRNFISFAAFFVFGGGFYGGWKWLYHSSFEEKAATARAHKPLRTALNKTEGFFRKFFSNTNLAKTYPKEMAAKKVRINSLIGLEEKNFNAEKWVLNVVKNKNDSIQITLNELKALPKTEIIFDFKCVEGWDQIQHWAGVRFIDFMDYYKLNDLSKMNYVGMQTPDAKYYVGLDMESAKHPQTILAYEMNDEPLMFAHGAPLRLIIPVKYGIKNLKRIGTISFSNERPADYWAQRGYDYYSGL